MRRLLLALLALGLLVGCGGPSATAASAVHTTTVDLPPSYRFDPPVIAVPAGATVTWTNDDHFTHSVQVQGGEVQTMAPGQRAQVRFDRPGTYPYVCTYHPQDMKGTVIVSAS